MPLEAILDRLDADRDAALDRLFALMRVPSISTDGAYAHDCRRAAGLLRDELATLGFVAESVPTAGHPVVWAEYHAGRAGRRHVMFYGHYDVQPVDPLTDWLQPPFEPAVLETAAGPQIHGRGASDDKGQLRTFIEAVRAILAVEGTLPFDLTIVIEGEEEIGSPHLEAVLRDRSVGRHADAVLVCDSPMWDSATPAINVRLRGLVNEQVSLATAKGDLHSGLHGGPARNAVAALVHLLAGLHRPDGSVAIPGFYEQLTPPPAELVAALRHLDFDAAAYLRELGQQRSAGEQDQTLLEQLWLRPTAEINGIWGGYAGPGGKTVVPAQAGAKISFRLVAGQSPAAIRAAFRADLEARLLPDCTLQFTNLGEAQPVAVDTDGPQFRSVCDALAAEWGKAPALSGSGGSLPVAAMFREVMKRDALLVGFALPDDRIHAPNEKYSLRSFEKGARSWVRILDALAKDTIA